MKKFINPKSLGKEPVTYSHGILVSFPQYLFTAGEVAMDDQGKIIGKGDIETQTEHIMENIKKILAETEMNFDNVIKVNMYLVNMNDLPKVIAVRNRYFQPNRPAVTAVEVAKLVKTDLLLEIEVIAVK
jgi:reactive intermediate/imine deaminase